MGDPDFRPTTCSARVAREAGFAYEEGTSRTRPCPCESMDVRGTCTCGHDAKEHASIDGRFGVPTPCGGTVMGPTSMSGNIVRTLQCSCDSFTQQEELTEVGA